MPTSAIYIKHSAIAESVGKSGCQYNELRFDASRSNTIYSNSIKTVQPASIKVRVKTKYK